MPAKRRLFHHDIAGALKVPHNALGGDGGHVFAGFMDTLAALEPQRERYGFSQVFGIGERELFVIGHRQTIAGLGERSKERKAPACERRG
jgi:hypothetical protein